MSRWTRAARLVAALSVATCATGCLGRLVRPQTEQQRVQVVCAPKAVEQCVISQWLVPAELSADQAGELALTARTEAKACDERHKAAVDCIRKHEGKE
jgi:hypothetical protein